MSTLAPNCLGKAEGGPTPTGYHTVVDSLLEWEGGQSPNYPGNFPASSGVEELSSHTLPSPSCSLVESRSRWEIK